MSDAAQSKIESRKSSILYLDPFSGVSGDMFVGALLDLGLDLARLHHELSKLNVAGYHLSSKKVMRGSMAATKFDVEIAGHVETEYDLKDGEKVLADANHGHSHGSDHGHSHGHEHASGSAAAPAPLRRNFAEIRTLIEASSLSENVKANALRAFQKLAEAEGRIHGLPPEKVHFHEVGAIDSIVDIVGACIGLELLGVDEIWCGPVALGSGGFIKCDHGLMPVPAPATLEIMKGLPIRKSPVEKELTTPTGAALVAALVKEFGALPPMRIDKTGYGAGSREVQAVPNVLRVALGTLDEAASSDSILEIRTNVDDLSAEVLGHVCERLLAAGALDVFFTPIQMKKNRPATMLTVLAEPHQLDAIAGILFKECSTFGLRYQAQSRIKLARRMVSVATEFGEVRVKIGEWQGQVVSRHPEFEDCRAHAEEKSVPVRTVIDAARRAAEALS